MITNIGNTKVQIPSEGMVLSTGQNYSKMVYLGEGAQEWEEVEDIGQIDADAQTEEIK
jgi:hypothetical protein